MTLSLSLCLSALLCDFLVVERKFASSTVKRNNGSEARKKKEKKRKKEKNDADGTWARYGSRAQNSARKISGSCENFRNFFSMFTSDRRSSVSFLTAPSSRIGLYASIMRGTGAKRSGTLENPFFSKSRSYFFHSAVG